jgi:hypothetical protein
MSQTLIPYSALSSPVKITDAANLKANIAALQNLDNLQTVAFAVICLIHELNSKGGTDYRTNHKQLRIDATTFTGGFSFTGMQPGWIFAKMDAAILWNTAYGLDNALTTDVNTIIKECGTMRETPEQTLRLFYFFLRYSLSLLGV